MAFHWDRQMKRFSITSVTLCEIWPTHDILSVSIHFGSVDHRISIQYGLTAESYTTKKYAACLPTPVFNEPITSLIPILCLVIVTVTVIFVEPTE
jgi:hypothetical protein